MKLGILSVVTLCALSGCVQTLEEYRPVVDSGATNSVRYERDLAACYSIAKKAEAEYQKRQQDELGANLIAGVLAGALVGAAVGDNSDWAKTGAVYGAAAGAVIGGMIAADKNKGKESIIGYKQERQCTDYTRYNEQQQQVYSHSTVTFTSDGKTYTLSFKK